LQFSDRYLDSGYHCRLRVAGNSPLYESFVEKVNSFSAVAAKNSEKKDANTGITTTALIFVI
jgi:hypothetical protein